MLALNTWIHFRIVRDLLDWPGQFTSPRAGDAWIRSALAGIIWRLAEIVLAILLTTVHGQRGIASAPTNCLTLTTDLDWFWNAVLRSQHQFYEPYPKWSICQRHRIINGA
jgi:hypothetical protein